MGKASSAADLRDLIRRRQWTRPTADLGQGWLQANLLIVPQAAALEFALFCLRNPRACPLLDVTDPGDPHPRLAAESADLRTDLPMYRVFRDGEPPQDVDSIPDLWREDFVAFLLGCSFTFEAALVDAGIPLHHLQRKSNVSMYRTGISCRPAGRFAGNLVVSMRPIPEARVDEVVSICSEFPLAHGAPIAIGNAPGLGIHDIERPDFGDPDVIQQGEIPVFWACGVTSQIAAAGAGLDIAIAHAPGYMFITDWKSDEAKGSSLAYSVGQAL